MWFPKEIADSDRASVKNSWAKPSITYGDIRSIQFTQSMVS